MHDVTFANNKTGWAYGEGGVILKTTNNGINWIQQNSGTGNILEGIHAVDSQYVYCDGWWNTILKTTNGGSNWIVIRNGTVSDGISFYGIYFLNRTTGWLLRNNYVLRTHDGGITFDSTHEIFTYLWDVFFKDSFNGVLCGDGSLIMKSTDGGVNWIQIQIPLYNYEIPNFYKESFIKNNGWIVGAASANNLGALCWRTTDFGSSWDTISRVPYSWNVADYCVYFSSVNTGWCGGEYGYIFKTSNSGFNWYQQTTPSNRFRNSMWFYNDNIGWAVGAQEEILFTVNGGEVMVEKISSNIPGEFKVYQNYPNPFNTQTIINYQLPITNYIKLALYNVLGKEMKILFEGEQKAGSYRIVLDGSNLPSGIYFYKMLSVNYFETKKMVLIK